MALLQKLSAAAEVLLKILGALAALFASMTQNCGKLTATDGITVDRRNHSSPNLANRLHCRMAEVAMLGNAVVFLIIALIAGLLGFFAIAGIAATIAKICFVVFLVLFLFSFISGRRTV